MRAELAELICLTASQKQFSNLHISTSFPLSGEHTYSFSFLERWAQLTGLVFPGSLDNWLGLQPC